MQIIEPSTSEQFEQLYRLRYEMLRQPWGQPKGSERSEKDATAIHAILLNDDGEAVGVCSMHLNTPQEAQIRFMGIRQDMQGKKLGDQLMRYQEERARQLGATRMMLHARENAVSFYSRNGYKLEEKSYLLFDTIQHYRMGKQL